MQKMIFNQKIQKKYMTMHDLVVKAKFYFLKSIQSTSLTDDQKNLFRDQISEISGEMNRHFTELRYAKITQYNIDEYEYNEQLFMKETRKYLELLIKGCVKQVPVKIKYDNLIFDEKQIDEDILASTIYGTRALGTDKIQGLNSFREYMMINVLTDKKNIKEEIQFNNVDQELLDLKISSFSERMVSRNALNPEIYFKVCIKIESLLTSGKKINIKNYSEEIEPDQLNKDELYIYYDNSYNLYFFYKIKNILIKLNVEIVRNINQENIFFNKKIICETQVSTNTVTAEIPLKHGLDKSTIESFTDIFNEILEDLELRKIYNYAISLVKKHISNEQNASLNRQKELTKEVSDGLDSIL